MSQTHDEFFITETPITESTSISSFNTYGFKNKEVTGEVRDLLMNSQILGLQEVTFRQLFRYLRGSQAAQTHGVILGKRNSAGEFCPIFYDKQRFRPVYAESVHLNGQGNRVATFAILEDRQTGAQVVLANTHLISGSANHSERRSHFDWVKNHASELGFRYGGDGVVVMGDFNTHPGSEAGDYNGQGTTDWGATIDGVLLLSEDDFANDPLITDGGQSDHHAVTRDFLFSYETTDNTLDPISDRSDRLEILLTRDAGLKRRERWALAAFERWFNWRH